MPERSVTHATFVVERTYPVPPARVFAAWSTVEGKSRWFRGGPEWKETLREMDFRVGGHERVNGAWGEGNSSAFDARYHDIVSNERIVYTYDMYNNGAYLSVSVATIEFKANGAGTTLKMTEQGAFFEGQAAAVSREHGTKLLMDRIGESLTV